MGEKFKLTRQHPTYSIVLVTVSHSVLENVNVPTGDEITVKAVTGSVTVGKDLNGEWKISMGF